MANPNVPSGLAPVRYMNGAPWNGAVNLYCILAANINAFWIGDPVTTVGSAGGDANGIPSVTLAAAGAAVRGVIVAIGTSPRGGPYINFDNLSRMYRPLGAQSINYYIAVVDDPMVIFEIQEAGAGSVLTTASVNRNANFNTGTRNAAIVPTVSPTYLDNASVNVTATLNLRILEAVPRPDNVPFTALQKWRVLINNHEFKTGTLAP
jgi:hypothetical protein